MSFSAIRMTMVLAVVWSHIAVVAGVDRSWWLTSGVAVECFFMLAGFWSLPSYARAGSPWPYLRRRLLRIWPPYAAVAVACFLAGGAETALPAADYFTSWAAWRHLFCTLCFAGFAAPDLPGVFCGNPLRAVNASLWFVRVVAVWYCLVPLLAAALRRWRPAGVVAAVAALSVAWRVGWELCEAGGCGAWCGAMKHQPPGQLLFLMAGVAARLSWPALRQRAAVVAAVCCAVLAAEWLFLHSLSWEAQCATAPLFAARHALLVLGAFALAALVAVAGSESRVLARLWPLPDVSYELFLVHFPVVQLLMAHGMAACGLPALYAVALPLSLAAACALRFFIKKTCPARAMSR